MMLFFFFMTKWFVLVTVGVVAGGVRQSDGPLVAPVERYLVLRRKWLENSLR